MVEIKMKLHINVMLYIRIKDVATLIKGLTNSLPNGIILHDDRCEIFDMRGKFPFCHSSFSLDNQAKKLLKIDKEPKWYAYLAFMPNKKFLYSQYLCFS